MTPEPTSQAAEVPTTAGLELIELQTFIVVANARSFSAAAQRLHVTQPTITGRINRLEAFLGTQLLLRTTRKVEMTVDGERLLHEASKTLEGLFRLVDGFRRKMRRIGQRVVVAATPTIAALRLPPIIQAYCERYPDVEVELLDLPYASVLASIDEGRADLAVLAYEGTDKRYRFTALWHDDMVLLAPKSHELARRASVGASELASVKFIVVDQYLSVRARIANALQAKGLALPDSKVVSNLNTLLGMLDAGLGVTLIPRSVSSKGNVAKHACIEIEGVDMTRTFGIATARSAKPNASVQSFVRFLRQADLQPKS